MGTRFIRLASVVLAALPCAASAVTVDLAHAKVVCARPGSEDCRRAAEELRRHLEIIAGPREETGGFVFAVGKRPAGAPEPAAFESLAQVCGDRVCIWGDDSRHGSDRSKGTLFAVYEFLDKALGVRWVCPGDVGIVAPSRTAVDLRDGASWRYRPVFALNSIRIGSPVFDEAAVAGIPGLPAELRPTRESHLAHYAEREQWRERMRVISTDRFRYGHAFCDWYDRFFATHPEWFGMDPTYGPVETGHRGLPPRLRGREKFCLSNPEIADAIVEDWRTRLGACRYFNICPNDGTPGFCRCADCLKLDTRRDGEAFLDHLTDRYLWFWNKLTGKALAVRPDVRTVAYIYSYYRFPPRREKVEHPDNMVFGIVPALTDDYVRIYDEWRAAGMRHFFLRPNYMCYSGVFPRGLEKYLYDNFRTSLEYGMMGVDYDGAPRPVTDFEYYVIVSLSSRPERGFEEIADEFYSQFGAAAGVARTYFERIRERARRTKGTLHGLILAKARHVLDDSELSKYAVLGHTQADLEADLEALRPGKDLRLTPAERRRFVRLVLRAKHAVLAIRFLTAAEGKDDAAFVAAAKALYEFRVKNIRELGDEACAWYSARNNERKPWARYAELTGAKPKDKEKRR